MRHKLCRSFHPWCPGVKNRCLFQNMWGALSDGCYWRHHPYTKGLPGPIPISHRVPIARPHRAPKLRDQHHEPPDLPETRQAPRHKCYGGARPISKRRDNPSHQSRRPETPRGSTTRRPIGHRNGAQIAASGSNSQRGDSSIEKFIVAIVTHVQDSWGKNIIIQRKIRHIQYAVLRDMLAVQTAS